MCEKYVGCLRSEFKYYPEGFGPVHSPTQINFFPSASGQISFKEDFFDLKVPFYPSENQKTIEKFADIL